MNNERFTIPELLFHPSNIGMHQAGIPEAIVESVNLTHSGTLYWKVLNSPVKMGKRLIYVAPCFINRSHKQICTDFFTAILSWLVAMLHFPDIRRECNDYLTSIMIHLFEISHTC